ncbi:MAG TPA: M56 family metallopeptidase [Acidobacteriaceae bacterium]|jgi:TonB family protein|nr:M56 family metallopeptidase [Acidobacteriaceae bacterium]
MTTLASWMLSYLANALWQVPLLFAAGWIAARLVRPSGPAAEHRIWVAVLVLQSALPAASVASWQWVRAVLPWPGRLHPGDGVVSVVMGPGSTLGNLPLPRFSLAAMAAAYGLACLFFLARFLWRCAGLRALRRDAVALPETAAAALCCVRCTHRLGLQGVSVASSTRVFSPVVLGFRRPVILLPAAMLPRLTNPDLEAVLAHECAHLLRNDFLSNLLLEALTLPITGHPLLWAARNRLTETREMVCDHLASTGSGRQQYAQSLLRLASVLIERTPVNTCHAIGIFDAHTFERRLMRLNQKPIDLGGARRAVLVLACAGLGLAACASAFALRVHVNTFALAAFDSHQPPNSVHVAAGIMAGQRISGENPVYPQEAKDQHVQGTVVLGATIGKDGTVVELHVVSGPPTLQKSSTDAVKTWLYKPYLLNGDPVAVETTINVIYSLKK